ncbi:hypothetical protein LIA77_04121 [Sarocladium implicatum]|nr:hypothetical protein LIA77_04121 [Sarocladium implicatum]
MEQMELSCQIECARGRQGRNIAACSVEEHIVFVSSTGAGSLSLWHTFQPVVLASIPQREHCRPPERMEPIAAFGCHSCCSLWVPSEVAQCEKGMWARLTMCEHIPQAVFVYDATMLTWGTVPSFILHAAVLTLFPFSLTARCPAGDKFLVRLLRPRLQPLLSRLLPRHARGPTVPLKKCWSPGKHEHGPRRYITSPMTGCFSDTKQSSIRSLRLGSRPVVLFQGSPLSHLTSA